MLNVQNYRYMRYVLIVNMVTALVPATKVKGRANDPLLHANWWRLDQHSAILVVCSAMLVGSALLFAVARANKRTWWVFVGCGIVTGDFPATFYWVTAPAEASVPLGEMYLSGTVCGLFAGLVLYALARTRTAG